MFLLLGNHRKALKKEFIMKKNLKVQPYLFPMPVLIVGTYCEDGTPDAMNAAWGTVCDFKQVALFLSAGHKTVANIKARKAFTVAVADRAHLIPCDYVGLVSANTDKGKMARSGLTVTESATVDAPVINELPFALECTLDRIDEESGCVYGNIENIVADESILDEAGNVDLKKLDPISYDPASRCYFTMGDKVGTAFRDGAVLK